MTDTQTLRHRSESTWNICLVGTLWQEKNKLLIFFEVQHGISWLFLHHCMCDFMYHIYFLSPLVTVSLSKNMNSWAFLVVWKSDSTLKMLVGGFLWALNTNCRSPLWDFIQTQGAARSAACHCWLLLLDASDLEMLSWTVRVNLSWTRTWPGGSVPLMIVKWINELKDPVTPPWRTLSPVFMGSTVRNDWTFFHVKLNMFVLKSASCDPNQDMSQDCCK